MNRLVRVTAASEPLETIIYRDGPWEVVEIPRTTDQGLLLHERVDRVVQLSQNTGWVTLEYRWARQWILRASLFFVLYKGHPIVQYYPFSGRVWDRDGIVPMPETHGSLGVGRRILEAVSILVSALPWHQEVDWRPNESIPEDFYST